MNRAISVVTLSTIPLGTQVNGTSGGPFLAHVNPKTGDGWVIGVIGGYQEGGDTPNISYSPRFFSAIKDLYETAVASSG